MQNKITFQFEDKLDYQLDAINSTKALFQGLTKQTGGLYAKLSRSKMIGEGDPVRNPEIIEGTRLLENLQALQLKNELFADNEVFNNNFTIEMETGTGKTYVYLRTILELYQEYGFKKFMIVVPSNPILLGVKKSIDMLSEHFQKLYGVQLAKHYFMFDTKTDVNTVSSKFVESTDLSIMLVSTYSFNKDSNRLNKEDWYGKVLWRDMSVIRPIVIIDEPQKFEGDKKTSSTLTKLNELNPLFTLRYSATHKKLYNQIYKLDSYAAFKKDLVKKIEVKTVHGVIDKGFPYIRYVEFTKDLYAKIEIFSIMQGGKTGFKTFKVRGSAPLYDLSGKLPQYFNYRISGDPHKLKPLKIETPSGFLELTIGQSNFEITQNEAIRIQIGLAIRNHFDKQIKMLQSKKQIKALSLFFVDSVIKVRDNTDPTGRGEYLRIFDEEFEKIRREEKYQKAYKKYPVQLAICNLQLAANQVREGYFAIDKNSKEVDIEDFDSNLSDTQIKVKAKSQEDIDRGIEKILSGKDELISFGEPLSFIFSHSALREGWDNPNVFTLCTLKHGGSEIAKKQEIGRGLRLPVDIYGNQNRIETELNELTVIANDYYDHFAESLQKDFNESMNFNKDEVTADIIRTTLIKAGISPSKITPELVGIFKDELFYGSIINVNNVLTGKPEELAKRFEEIEFTNEILKDHSIKIKEEFAALMREKGTHKIPIKNGDNEPVENEYHSYINDEDFAEMLGAMSERLSKRAIYRANIDKDNFIAACIEKIDEMLKYRRVINQYKVETGKAGFDETQKMAMSDAKTKDIDNVLPESMVIKSDFEICNYIMYHTSLPRFAIFKIIWGIERKELLSNQDILDDVIDEIKDLFMKAKAETIYQYDVIDGYTFDTGIIFDIDSIDEDMWNEEYKVYKTDAGRRKAISKYYRMDSDGEYEFAGNLEQNDNVLLFTKIKKGGFVIDTPYGNYSPDWAVVYKENENEKPRLYFIVETKMDKKERILNDEEKLKIKCGKLHFKQVSTDVTFDWANSYSHFKTVFNVKES